MGREQTFVIDFDSTLTQCESLDELARICLDTHENRQEIMWEFQEVTRQGMAGELAFDESLRRRLRLFAAGKPDLTKVAAYLRTQISPSAIAAQEWFTHNSKRIYIVSGGFEELIIPIAQQFGIAADHIFANRFLYDGDAITGFDPTRFTSKAGGKAAQIAALRLPHPIIVIGDGYTDYEIKTSGAADEFWAFTETVDRPQVVANADRVITSFTEVSLPYITTTS